MMDPNETLMMLMREVRADVAVQSMRVAELSASMRDVTRRLDTMDAHIGNIRQESSGVRHAVGLAGAETAHLKNELERLADDLHTHLTEGPSAIAAKQARHAPRWSEAIIGAVIVAIAWPVLYGLAGWIRTDHQPIAPPPPSAPARP